MHRSTSISTLQKVSNYEMNVVKSIIWILCIGGVPEVCKILFKEKTMQATNPYFIEDFHSFLAVLKYYV